MRVTASAPARIDLAGGTLDIYPLYLFLEGGITVNMAIGLGAEVCIDTRADERVLLRSLDTGATQQAASASELALDGELPLLARIVRFYAPNAGGLEVTSRSRAPSGSGLGASSSLLIALSHALNRMTGAGLTSEQIIEYGARLEAQVIGIPTGKQDYYAATYGGVNAIWFEVAHDRLEPIELAEEDLAHLERSVILTFTGESHFSGTSNWNMLKAFIEKAPNTVERMQGIKQTALAMREALCERDWDRFAALLGEEWQNRKGLADGVTTPRIEAMVEAARQGGALASKICGAGGGGCMITLAPPERREAVVAALAQTGAQPLEYHIARQGVQTQASD